LDGPESGVLTISTTSGPATRPDAVRSPGDGRNRRVLYVTVLTLAFVAQAVFGQNLVALAEDDRQTVAKWRVSSSLVGPESPEVYLATDAKGVVRGSCDGKAIDPPPYIVIGCRAQQLWVTVHVMEVPHPDEGNKTLVSLRFDNELEREVRAPIVPLGRIMFSLPEPERVIADMGSHKELSVRFNPYCQRPQTLVFDLRGVSDLLSELPRHGCVLGAKRP
jgi:hypothetical protein